MAGGAHKLRRPVSSRRARQGFPAPGRNAVLQSPGADGKGRVAALAPGLPAGLDRLKVTTTLGQSKTGAYQRLYAFGARSFSIWTPQGEQVFDSGAAIERTLAEKQPSLLDDGRSDDKGPEPEGVVVGKIDGRSFAFVGLERSSAVIVFDVSRPKSPKVAGLLAKDGDVSPEGLKFVPAAESPTGKPLLVVTNEVSRTTTAFELAITP
jgi:hypothetical protein